MTARILAFAWEVGGAAALIPVLGELARRGHDCVWQAMGPAERVFAERLETPPAGDPGCDLVLGAVGHPRNAAAAERWLELARDHPSLVVLDNWKGLERYFDAAGRPRPGMAGRKLAVMDATVRDELVAMGLPADAIAVCGHSLLEAWQAAPPSPAARKALRAGLDLPPDRRVVVVASEPMHDHDFLAPCDGTCRGLLGRLGDGWEARLRPLVGADALLVARPHPSERWQAGSGTVVLGSDRATDLDLVAVADMVAGVSNMLLLQAGAAGVPTLNLRPLLTEWDPRCCFLRPTIWTALSGSGQLGALPGVPAAAGDWMGSTGRIAEEVEALL